MKLKRTVLVSLTETVKKWWDRFRFYQLEYQKDINDLDSLEPKLCDLSSGELADLGYCFRETSEFLNGMKKEYTRRQDLIAREIFIRALVEYKKGGTDTSFQGQLASATPKIKDVPNLPKRGTPEYGELCKWLGVKHDHIAKEIVSFHYPKMSDLLTEMAEEGKNPPPGILKTAKNFTATYRRKRNIQDV